MLFRILNGAMAALFAFAVIVQYNDPDPVRWILIYGAACGAAAARAVRGAVPLAVPVIVLAVALAWSGAVAAGGPRLDVYRRMFDGWEMKSISIEEAREASGLFIVSLWMGVLAVSEWRARKKHRITAPHL